MTKRKGFSLGNVFISRSEQKKSSNAPCTCAALNAGLLCSAESKPDIPVIYSHSQKSNAITFSAHSLFNILSHQTDYMCGLWRFVDLMGSVAKEHYCRLRVSEKQLAP